MADEIGERMKDGRRDVLVIDIGGSFIKLYSDGDTPEKFESSRDLTPKQLVSRAKEVTKDWEYDAVSIGYPGRVDHNGPTAEPGNLGDGWVGFDFEKAFGHRVRIVNDAALQALGAYDGGRMLFLGLGTGLGSAMIADHVIVPMELGCLPFRDTTMAGFLGKAGLEKYGEAAWAAAVEEITGELRCAFSADYIVLGGGNVERLTKLPPHCRKGGNNDAYAGGNRLWEEEVEHHDRPASAVWRVVR